MLAAVLYGTARQSYDPYGEQALGKTGTCNDENLGGRLGWFASYADQANPKIVLVVLLHGGSRIISGPHASEIAGRIYRGLNARNYFADADRNALKTDSFASGAASAGIGSQLSRIVFSAPLWLPSATAATLRALRSQSQQLDGVFLQDQRPHFILNGEFRRNPPASGPA